MIIPGKRRQIYLAGPIGGLAFDKVEAGYAEKARRLEKYYDVMVPIVAHDCLRGEDNLKTHGFVHPVVSDHAIIERDRWMVIGSELMLADLAHADRVSIGTMMELAWAHDHGLHTVTVMEPGNIHEHAFVFEASDVVFSDLEDALDYLISIAIGRV